MLTRVGIAYWPQAETVRGKKGQMSQIPASYVDEEEDTMPLLPRSRKRLLGDTPEVEESFNTASKQRGIASQTQTLSTPKPKPVAVARRTRGGTVDSDVSISSAPRPTATKTQKGRGRGKLDTPIVIDEEDEDEVDVGLIGSRRTGTGTGRGSGKTGGTSTLDGETTRSSRAKGTQSVVASGTTGRRRLLPADEDDDGIVSRSIATQGRAYGA
jgi:hypothetical protein